VSKTPEVTESLTHRRFNDPAWTDWVLDQLWDNEFVVKEDGKRYPKADGLRRVFHNVVGPIISMTRSVAQAPAASMENDYSGMATIRVSLTYKLNDLPDQICVYDEVADCYDGNTIRPYSLHPSATASTMAEGRALRKIMNLKVLTIEEMSAPPGANKQRDSVPPMKEHQKNTIKTICKNIEIDPVKAVKYIVGKDVKDLNIEDGAQIIGALSDWQISKNGKFNIPADFK
jgi:hypothetical protein